MRWSYICLLIMILLLPWYIVRWQVVGIPITLLEVSALITIVVWLVERRQFSLSFSRFTDIAKAYKSWLLWSGLFLLASVIATIISPNHRQALGYFKAYIVEPMIIALVMIDVIGDNRRRWWGILVALFGCAGEVVLVGFSQVLFGWPNLAPAELMQGRISSFYNSANRVGLFLGPLIAIGASMVIGRVWSKSKTYIIGAFVLAMLLVVGLSRSRGGLMGLAVIAGGLLLFWLFNTYYRQIFNYGQWWRYGLLALLLFYAISCIGFVWFANHPPTVANPYSRPGFTTFTVRQCLWQGTKGVLTSHPLTGAGLAGFTQEYLAHITCDAEPLEDPHMLVLNFWSETGLLGLVAFFGLMVTWLWQSSDLIMVDGPQRWIGVGLLLALLYCLVHGLVDIPYFKNDLSMEWWILVGLVITSQRVWKQQAIRVKHSY
jgi:O-antigen ligase